MANALQAWREAERLLDELPPTSPDHETVALLVLELRSAYGRLTEASAMTQQEIGASWATIDSARSLLRAVRATVASRNPIDGAEPAR